MSSASAGTSSRLPDFVVIGAQKAATTTLWAYLDSHPDVYMSTLKETNFFLTEGNWSRGVGWYESLFEEAPEGAIKGEASPGYTMFPTFAGAAERMAKTIPDARLIYMIREPIERMVSNWVQSRATLLETRPLRPALLSDIRYVSLSRYATQIEQYLKYFDRSSLLILRSEDLQADAAATMRTICQFLGVAEDRLPSLSSERLNRSDGKLILKPGWAKVQEVLSAAGASKLSSRILEHPSRLTYRPLSGEDTAVDPDLRRRLSEYLAPEMRQLRELVGPDVDLWGYS